MALSIKSANDSAEVLIYEDIGVGLFDGLSAKQFAQEIKALPRSVCKINVRINSSGGDVFDGHAIYNTLKRHPANISVDIDGAALSIASVIAMAADPGELRMASNAFMMIHDPWSVSVGSSADMRKTAELLDNIKSQIVTTYSERTQNLREQIAQWMEDETWLNADDAVEYGFVDTVTPELAVAAHANSRWCQNIPEDFHEHTSIAHKKRCDDIIKALDK